MICIPINHVAHLLIPTYRSAGVIAAYRGEDMEFDSPSIQADDEGSYYLNFNDGGNLSSTAPSSLTLLSDFAFTVEEGTPHLCGWHDSAGDWGISHEISGTDDIVTWLRHNGKKDGIHTGYIPEAGTRHRVATSIGSESGVIRTSIGGLLITEEERDPVYLQEIIAELANFHVGKLGEFSPLSGTVRLYAVAGIAQALSKQALANATEGGFNQVLTSDEEEVLFTG